MRNYTNAAGQVIGFDTASHTWRVYDPATQTLGATAAVPPAGTTFNADLVVPSLVVNNQQQQAADAAAARRRAAFEASEAARQRRAAMPWHQDGWSVFVVVTGSVAALLVAGLLITAFARSGGTSDTTALDALKTQIATKNAEIAALKRAPAVNPPAANASVDPRPRNTRFGEYEQHTGQPKRVTSTPCTANGRAGFRGQDESGAWGCVHDLARSN